MERGLLRVALSLKSVFLTAGVLFLLQPGVAVSQTQSHSQPQTKPQPQTDTQTEKKQESLVEASQKEKARRANYKATKVYTNDDVVGLSTGGVSVVGNPNSAGKEGNESQTANRSNSEPMGREEAFWRSRAQQLRDQMSSLDDQIARLRQDIEKNGGSGFDAQTGLSQNVIYVNDKNGRLKTLEQQRADLDKRMDELIEEGRKAGAPASWFR